MTYLPPANVKQTDTALFAGLAAAVAFFLTGNMKIPPLWLWQTLSVIALAWVVLTLTRYRFCQHKYILQEGDLIVVKQQGKKEERACFLSMQHAKQLLSPEAFAEKKRSCRCYNYVQNIVPAQKAYLLFDDGNEALIVILEPNGSFLDALTSYIR